jgi:hypothetical protein
MVEKTMVEKAGEAVGFGIAMAEDVVDAVKTAVGAAVTTVTEVLKKAPKTKAPVKQVAKKAPAKKATKRAPATKAIKKLTTKMEIRSQLGRRLLKNSQPRRRPRRRPRRKP